MTPARMRRLASDYEEVKKNFAGHKHILVTPVGGEPPEQYHVTYFVNGIYLRQDGKVETLARHEVDIILHAEYPRYKPLCRITTPIWHPNFRDGQICIGDIWGAGESLSDIIVNIGDMIQYKSWNSYSPLSAEAAKWAIENKHLFPVGNLDLFYADYASAKDTVEIDLLDGEGKAPEAKEPLIRVPQAVSAPAADRQAGPAREEAPKAEAAPAAQPKREPGWIPPSQAPKAAPASGTENDFEITAEELAGIEFVPTASRMQTMNRGGKGRINFKTILMKGLLWALAGALLGFGISELLHKVTSASAAASLLGYDYLSEYYRYDDLADAEFDIAYEEYEAYCKSNSLDPDDDSSFTAWLYLGMSDEAEAHLNKYSEYDDQAEEQLYRSFLYEFDSDTDALTDGLKQSVRVSTGIWSAIIALFLGLALGVGEGVYYGSLRKALICGAIGAGVSLVIGFLSGDLAQLMYAAVLKDDSSLFVSSLVRGLGWSILGLGIGLAVGLIRPGIKRILFCCLGGMLGGFLGGFLFNYVVKLIPNDIAARGVAIVLMGLLIGVGVGLLEQFAKQAWLKVVRGEFEGKEYLVFSGTTSIGNNSRNTIVLFKDKLVGPHHCDIVQEGSKYVIVDAGTPMGTVVNGMRVTRQALRRGDSIAVGNSVMVFNTK